MQFLPLRALFLLAFVVAMPVLALPAVARRIDELLYPPPATNFSSGPAVGPLPANAETKPPVADVSPASWQTPVEPTAEAPGLESPRTEPPLLPATPGFATANAGGQVEANAETPIDRATLGRLEQIRSRLEQLGAHYVLVEMSADGRSYRCHCQMLVDANSAYTRPFEATTAGPLEAAEQVLRDVERWRLAAAAGTARP